MVRSTRLVHCFERRDNHSRMDTSASCGHYRQILITCGKHGVVQTTKQVRSLATFAVAMHQRSRGETQGEAMQYGSNICGQKLRMQLPTPTGIHYFEICQAAAYWHTSQMYCTANTWVPIPGFMLALCICLLITHCLTIRMII